MKSLIRLLKQKMVVQLLGVVALCASIWFAGPKVAFAGKAPLESEFNRLLAVLIVVLAWAAYNELTQVRSRKRDQQLSAELSSAQPDRAKAAIDEAKSEEVATLRRKFEEALQLLKKTQSKGKRGRQYLYQLPWYVIIGPPGCGKTTLLFNSGLKFPLSEQLGQSPVKGFGGTRNCDWLFADEAIFLDTAGRYTTQDSHQAVDQSAWHGFLDLIKRYRPRRPINGVLVAVSLSDLHQQTEEERRQHARAIRQRVMELYEVLQVRFPIYAIFTKCDLVAGFVEFFADLNQEERTQVWGETFPGGDSKGSEDHISGFEKGFDELLQRLHQRTYRRIQEERDIMRRSLILDFPQQMVLLKPLIMGFLRDVFGGSRFETEPLLRGVYFTSGTQKDTPFDRVMGLLAAAYGMERRSLSVFQGLSKSFFITRLLKEVVVPEAELARVDPRLERRRRWLQWAAYGFVLALMVSLLSLWSVSYVRNMRAIDGVKACIEQVRTDRREGSGLDLETRSLLVGLNAMESAGGIYKNPSLWMGFGLYQGDKVQDGLKLLYDQVLKNNLLPTIVWSLVDQLDERMRGDATADLDVLYGLLKVYLMFGLPQRMDPGIAGNWIKRDWERVFFREPQLQAQMRVHSDNLLKLPPDAIPLDEGRVSEARRRLNAVPLYFQIYAQLRSVSLPDHSNDFRLQDVLPPRTDEVLTTTDGRGIQSLTIPGFYTSEGYNIFFKKQGLELVKQYLDENWVLETPYSDQSRDLNRLYDDLQKLYFSDYQKAWSDLLNSLTVRKAQGPQAFHQSIQIIDRLAGPDTPLLPLLEAIATNTSLSGDTSISKPQDAGSGMPPRPPLIGAPQDPAQQMESRFKDLNQLLQVRGSSPPPINEILKNLNEVRDVMIQSPSSSTMDNQPLVVATKKAGLAFGHLPDPLKGLLLSATKDVMDISHGMQKSELNAAWKAQVVDFYRKALQGRYPLVKGSPYDATMNDFSRFFASNGIMDQFFQDHLRRFVDSSGTRWRQTTTDAQGISFSPAVLSQFQNVERIREAFFGGTGQTPSVQFELRPVFLDTKVKAFRLNIEGQTTEYLHGSALPSSFKWPGPQLQVGVKMSFELFDGREVSRLEQGPWAWLRTLDKAVLEHTSLRNRMGVTFQADGYRVRYELIAGSVYNPFKLTELSQFRCPDSL